MSGRRLRSWSFAGACGCPSADPHRWPRPRNVAVRNPGEGPTDSESSVSDWVEAEKGGRDAARKLWERYVADVVQACEARLTASQRRCLSGEDIAQEVFHDFFIGIRSRAFPRLNDRNDVRQILEMLVERTCIDHHRRHSARKAGGGKVLAFTDVDPPPPGTNGMAIDDVPARQAMPIDEAGLRRALAALVPDLTDPLLQDLVSDRIMGFTAEEIAERQGISIRSVYRKLRVVIRTLQSRRRSAH